MEITGAVIVVTGGGNGIGRALARRFAAEGAAGVAVADLDGAAAERVAAEIGAAGGAAIAVAGDAASEDDVADLLDRTEAAFGPVDVYAANAGVAVGTDLDTPDELWDLALGVNVRAHVVAARLLVPGWIERGAGYFLSTASAAGLLSQIGSAPYAVSKHAAVAFAEWLSITHGGAGVRVSCLCPMGVDTAMLDVGTQDAGIGRLATAAVRAAGAVLDPDDVAGVVVDAMRAERFLILPHPEVLEYFRHKGSDYDRWLAGMRRLQANLGG
jgi:NAD(P)-dependent dehydrogenase (short-subunit alcohol dehydrogenase family)